MFRRGSISIITWSKLFRSAKGNQTKKLLRDFILSLPATRGELRIEDIYFEVPSEFLSIFMLTELVRIAGIEIDCKRTANWLLSFKNDDGGFSMRDRSNLNSTYYAVASLYNLGYQVNSLRETVEYVRECEKPYGGFTSVPEVLDPIWSTCTTVCQRSLY